MGFWACTYGLNFCYDFSETFVEDRKTDKLHGTIFFSNWCLGKQVMPKEAQNEGERTTIYFFKFLNFLF